MRGIAQDAGLDITRIYISGDKKLDRYRSDWMLLTKDAGLLKALPVELPAGEQGKDDFSVGLWTDQFNNLFSILKTAN